MRAHQLLVSTKYVHRFHQYAGRVAVSRTGNSPRDPGYEPPVGVCKNGTLKVSTVVMGTPSHFTAISTVDGKKFLDTSCIFDVVYCPKTRS